ncbi:SEC-C metal-binding domain-containing protein [Christiangramia sp. LLG6405-1]|uniref:SEC-C metal-binding domain-containing protein n=1 Tax=Christiangramia sp. LLG6405-1 TaxID=3160832 RepID=UPI00386DFB37
MNGIIAYCENENCGAAFLVPNLIGGAGQAQIEFQNTRVGPCPNCGSQGLVPDGIYKYFDHAISFVKGPRASLEKLLALKGLLENYVNNPTTKEEVVKEVEKISPEYAETIQKTPETFDYSKWINTILAILTAAILVQQTYFKGNDDQIKDKIIEQLLKQNEKLIDQKTITPVNAIKKKVGRNEPCPCGSQLKYKKCCLNKN